MLGREKKPYSIWRKMEEKKEGFHRLSDIYGFRIITHSVGDCYTRARRGAPALAGGAGAVQGLYQPAEVERLPLDPHHGLGARRQAGRGADPHARRCTRSPRPAWRRTGPTGTASGSRTRSRSIPSAGCARSPSGSRGRRTRSSSSTSSSRCSPTRSSASRPKGEVVKLPRGATPIDFAYAIHTRIGDSCVGAKVDGQRVPLWTKLRNGQSVTIIRAEGQRPQPSWEDMVVTGPRQGGDPAQPARRAAGDAGAARARDRAGGAGAGRQEGDRQGAGGGGAAARARGGRGRAGAARGGGDDRQGAGRDALPRAPARGGAAARRRTAPRRW